MEGCVLVVGSDHCTGDYLPVLHLLLSALGQRLLADRRPTREGQGLSMVLVIARGAKSISNIMNRGLT